MDPRLSGLLVTGRNAARMLTPFAPLATRLVFGWYFVQTGLGKWQNFDRTANFFGTLGLPFPSANAALVATVELVGGACLILGLGTRLFAALLATTMVVAILTADRAKFLDAFNRASETSLTDVTPVVPLLILLWLISFGAGRVSVDDVIARRLAAPAR